jgi:hypothetical protein
MIETELAFISRLAKVSVKSHLESLLLCGAFIPALA